MIQSHDLIVQCVNISMSRPEIATHPSDRMRLLLLVGVMTLVAFAIAGVSILTLYQVSLEAEKARLVGVARQQADLLAGMVRSDDEPIDGGYPLGANVATMTRVINAFEYYAGFKESGEFVLASRNGAEISFLASGDRSGKQSEFVVPWDSEVAEPMRRALLGESGTVTAPDYAGTIVLAAYEPVANLNLGLVAKIDLSEMRRPFVEAAVLSAIGVGFILLIGVYLFRQISAPILLRDEAEKAARRQEARLSGILDLAVEAVVSVGEDQCIQIFNGGAEAIFGYAASEVIGKPIEMLMPERSRAVHDKHMASFEQSKRPRLMGAARSEITGLRKDGSEFSAEASISRIEVGGEKLFTATLYDLTERKEAEAALRESEAVLANAQRIAHIGSWEWDIPNDKVSWSDENFRIYNLAPQESTPSYEMFLEFIHPDDRARVDAAVRAALDDDQPYLIDHRIVLENDVVRVLRERAEVYRDDSGKPVRMAGTVQDITEQRHAEEVARREKKQAEDYLNIAGSLIMALDAEGRITLMNETARRTLECEDEEVLGKLWIETFAPEEERKERYQWYLNWLVEDGREVEANAVTVVTRTGKHLLTRWHNRAIRDEAGKATGMLCSGEDITESTKAAAALRSSEARYRSIIDSTNEGFSRIDEDMKMVEANDALCRMLGYEREEMLGMRPFDLVIEADHPEVERRIRANMHEGVGATSREIQFRKRDGSLMDARVSSNSYFDEDGKLSGRFSFVTDLTEQKERDAQLRQAQKMEAVGQLTSGIAHDFNNILAVVLGNLEFAIERAEQGNDTSKQLDLALQAAERGADLNRRLLAFSRNQVTESRPVDAVKTIKGMTNILKRTLGEKIEHVEALPDSLPPTVLDTAQLESAILNLAINARDAMPDGGVFGVGASAVDAAGQESPGMVRIRVWDTGTGMSPEVKERAMEPFFTTKEVGQGSGLGLSMVYGFAEQYGGEIRISSEPGGGTTVDILLPITEAGDSVLSEATADQRISPANGNQTVLVVEDQKDVRDIVVTNLEILGYRVLIAEGGKEALSLIEAHDEIDLILCDMVMPGMNGEEIVAVARAMNPGLRCLFMSGFPEKRASGRQSSATDIGILHKPFTRAALAKTIRECLGES